MTTVCVKHCYHAHFIEEKWSLSYRCLPKTMQPLWKQLPLVLPCGSLCQASGRAGKEKTQSWCSGSSQSCKEMDNSYKHSSKSKITTVCVCSVTQSCLSNSLWPCGLPSSSVHGIFQQEYWSGLLFPSPRDPPDPGINPTSPVFLALADGFFTTSHLGSPITTVIGIKGSTNSWDSMCAC